MTNYEKIKKKTVEELAYFLCTPCDEYISEKVCDTHSDCGTCRRDWLNSEVRGYVLPDEYGFYDDRSKFVKLPYPLKIGDKVWSILKDLDEISLRDYKVTVGQNAVNDIPDTVTEVGVNGFWYAGLRDGKSENLFDPYDDEFVRWSEIGENVFLTREQAEQALKEMK